LYFKNCFIETWFMNLWFWTISIIMNITHWKNDDICYMTISTHFLM
jgi:hypothetical protein